MTAYSEWKRRPARLAGVMVLAFGAMAMGCGQVILPARDGGAADSGPGADALAVADAAPADASPADAAPAGDGSLGCVDDDLGSALGDDVYVGNTSDRSDDSMSCDGEGVGDIFLAWTAPEDGRYEIDTCGSDFDTVLSVRADSCDGAEIACNDDTEFCDLESFVTVDLTAGQRVIVIVDGYEEEGPFVLSIYPE